MFRLLFSAFLVLFITAYSSANALPVTEQRLIDVAESKQWQHLLHYRFHPFTLRFMSQNDGEAFFLSSEGKYSLRAELDADLQAFLQVNMVDNESAQCRFPARYHWLKQQFPELDFVDQSCSEFMTWAEELDTHFLTIIFPASHINSPSSMYGHTLIRMDRADESRNKLLAYSANFAANVNPNDNELSFTWKGLTGGYPGVVSVLPYYAKTNEYSRMESRDIWEYRLNLHSEEVAQFVRHIWETKDSFFDYYFFDENCSYRLLALLDASSERLDLASQFNFTAAPVDTVRALQEAGVIERKEYRPSSASEMEHKSQQSSAEVLAVAKQLVDDFELAIDTALMPLDEQDKSRALELAYAYARYLSVKKNQASPALRARTVALLSARSKQTASSNYEPIPVPQYSDDQAHRSQRLKLNVGAASSTQGSEMNGFVDLGWRIAFHEVMDLPQGFAEGAQIVMGDFNLRAWEGGTVKMQNFTFIDILSLSEETHFQSPIAWSVSTGGERFVGQDAEFYYYLKTAFGKAYNSGFGRFYGLAEVQLLVDDQFHRGGQLSLGPRAGWLLSNRYVQAQVEVNYQGLAMIDQTKRTTAKAELGFRVNDNLQVRLKAEQQWFKHDAGHWHNEEISAGLNWYF